MREHQLIITVVTGSTPRTRPGNLWGHIDDGLGNLAAEYALTIPAELLPHNVDELEAIDYVLYSRASTMRACNLMSGMEVLDARPLLERRSQAARRDDEAWTKFSTWREHYIGDIWSLMVADDRTYVGDHIVTHQ